MRKRSLDSNLSAGLRPQLIEYAFTLFVELVRGALFGLESGAQPGEFLNKDSLFGDMEWHPSRQKPPK